MSNAYFVLVTWPDGTEGLLFPRPGNVPINTTEEKGLKDFETTVEHLKEFFEDHPNFENTQVRLVRFTRHEVVQSFPVPVEKIPPTVVVGDLQEAERKALLSRCAPAESTVVEALLKPSPTACTQCGREMSHTEKWGWVCEYCVGIED